MNILNQHHISVNIEEYTADHVTLIDGDNNECCNEKRKEESVINV